MDCVDDFGVTGDFDICRLYLCVSQFGLCVYIFTWRYNQTTKGMGWYTVYGHWVDLVFGVFVCFPYFVKKCKVERK